MNPRLLIILFAFMQWIIATFTETWTFTHEESMWQYIGQNWFSRGLAPYDGGVDNKSPLIFAVFGLSDLISGLNVWFPRLLGIVCQSAGIYYLYKIAKHLTADQGEARARQAGIITMTIYGLSLLWHATGGKYVSFTETYAITFLIIGVYYYLTWDGNARRAFVSGIMAGIAFAWRISACFGILAILVHSVSKQRKSLVPFIAGGLLSFGILFLLAVVAGIDAGDMIYFLLLDNFGQGSTTDHSLGWKLNSFFEGFFYSEIILFYPFLAAYFLLKKRYQLLATWLICEFIGMNLLGIYARPHFKHLLPALALMSGLTVAHFVAHYNISLKRVLFAVWILFIPKHIEPLLVIRKVALERALVQEHTCTDAHPRPTELPSNLWENGYAEIRSQMTKY